MEYSKKWGMLNVVNQLFKIYFKVSHCCHVHASVRDICSSDNGMRQ